MAAHHHEQPDSQLPAHVVTTLVDNHRKFLGFLQRRVGDKALAEDILQDAFVRGVDRLGSLNQDESAVAWFYRLLRNAVVDHHRRLAASNRKLERFANEFETSADDSELSASVCGCVRELAETLKPEYAEALRRIELDGLTVHGYAAEAGITKSNAAVRVFRARQALRKRVTQSCGTCAEHGCLDCSCEGPPGGCG